MNIKNILKINLIILTNKNTHYKTPAFEYYLLQRLGLPLTIRYFASRQRLPLKLQDYQHYTDALERTSKCTMLIVCHGVLLPGYDATNNAIAFASEMGLLNCETYGAATGAIVCVQT